MRILIVLAVIYLLAGSFYFIGYSTGKKSKRDEYYRLKSDHYNRHCAIDCEWCEMVRLAENGSRFEHTA